MSKLFTLKSWLTLEDAAKHLSSVLSEEVTPADLLQIGIEGQLKLSVNLLNKGYLRKGEIIESKNVPLFIICKATMFPKSKPLDGGAKKHLIDEAKLLSGLPLHEFNKRISEELKEAVSCGEFVMAPLGDYYKENLYVRFGEVILSVDGIWDIVIESAAQLDISNMLQEYLGGPEVTLTSIDGAWLENGDGCLYCVQERFDDEHIQRFEKDGEKKPYLSSNNFFPIPYLPEGSAVVIRRANLDKFVHSLEEATHEGARNEEKPSSLLAVAALIELLKKGRSNRTQDSIIEELQEIVPKGLSESNMKKMLPEANRLLKEAKSR